MDKTLLIGLAALAAWFAFKPKSEEEKLIDAWIAKIKATPEWIAQETQSALQKGISLDQQLREVAIWVIAQGWQL